MRVRSFIADKHLPERRWLRDLSDTFSSARAPALNEAKETALARYRLLLFRNGELETRVIWHCADDLDALAAARNLSKDHVVEVFSEERFVARVKHGEAPLNVISQSG